MKIDAALGRRLATLVLFGFLGFLIWRLVGSQGQEVELVYDLARVGRTDLVELRAVLRRDGELVREATFFYAGGEGSAPTRQVHKVKLREGPHEARLTLRFARGPLYDAALPFTAAEGGPVVLPVPPPR